MPLQRFRYFTNSISFCFLFFVLFSLLQIATESLYLVQRLKSKQRKCKMEMGKVLRFCFSYCLAYRYHICYCLMLIEMMIACENAYAHRSADTHTTIVIWIINTRKRTKQNIIVNQLLWIVNAGKNWMRGDGVSVVIEPHFELYSVSKWN